MYKLIQDKCCGIKNLIANALCVTKSEPKFPIKGSVTTPLDSSELRVKMLLKTFLDEYKRGHTNNTKYAYEYEQCKAM